MIRLLAALVVVLSLVGACGGDDEQASDTASPSTSPSPATSRTPSPSATVLLDGLSYTVVAGDTLGAIAALYGVTVEAIVAANDISDPAALQVGQVLVIPGSSGPVATDPPTSDPTPVVTGSPATGVGLLALVDKQHALPSDYAPPGVTSITADYVAPGYSARLRGDVIAALTQMLDASGFDIRVVSGYRSYSEQVTTFNYWVSVLGYDEAMRVSAMAGHSEHQLGSTVDL
ncbi:MAG: LysM peptidoglycan-binding domain-containing protein, partial [Dehalococcoidia bacterium]